MNPLLKFVAKQLFGQKGMIANNKAVNFEAAKLAEKLSEFGIDPSSIKTEKQLEGIVNQIKELQKKRMAESMEVISQDDPRFKGIMSKMMGSNVIKRDFGKPFKEEVKKKSDEEILSNIKKSNERSVQNLRMQMMDDKVANDMFQGGPSRDPKTDADMLAEFIAEDAGKIYDDLPTKERLKFYDRAYNAILRYKRRDPEDMADGGRIGLKDGPLPIKKDGFFISPDFSKMTPEEIELYKLQMEMMKKGFEKKLSPEGLEKLKIQQQIRDQQRKDRGLPEEVQLMADGGRIGFKKGMDRRTFMKMVGGLTALPFLGKFFKGAEVVAPVAEKAAEVASGAPPYFFNLVNRIRALGTKFAGPKERSESFRYKDYEMDIDYDTGAIDIKKTKEAMIPGGDEAGVAEEVIMTYKPGMADETTKGRKVVDEYEEYTARPDIDGKMKDVEDGVPDEVVKDGSISKEELEQEIIDQLARDKKASGGIAMMLGE